MAVVINPSVNVQIVYSTEFDYNYLLNNGFATYGDLIIEASSNNGNGVLHINDTDFYFSGFAVRKNGQIIHETKNQYITSNSVNKGSIEFTDYVKGDTITAPTIGFDRLIYNKTGKELATVVEGTNIVPWRITFNRDVYLSVEDFYIGNKLFSQTYLTHEDTSLLFQSKAQAQKEYNELNSSLNNAAESLKQQVNSSINEITSVVKNVDASILNIRQLIYNTSSYTYRAPVDLDIYSAKTVKDALDILAYDMMYELPEDVSVICTVEPSTFIRGLRLTNGIKFSWRMVNYGRDSAYRSYTYQTYRNATTTDLYTYTDTITDNTANLTSDIVQVLRIGNNYTDSHGNKPKEFVYEFRCKIINEEYYYTYSLDNIPNNTFNSNSEIIQYVDTDEGYKKFICYTYQPQYIYFALFRDDIPDFFIYETDDNGIIGERGLVGGVTKVNDVILSKYNKQLSYSLFRTNQKLLGYIAIEYKIK